MLGHEKMPGQRMPGQRIDASEPCQTIKARWEKRHQDRHRHNVLTAKPAVTSSWSSDPLKPQPRYGHLDYNANKAMVQEERFATIEYENSLLLGKMRRIMSVGTAATNKAFIQVEELPPRSLNEGRRRRELERITADNMSIVRRIQLCAPSSTRFAIAVAQRQRAQYTLRSRLAITRL